MIEEYERYVRVVERCLVFCIIFIAAAVLIQAIEDFWKNIR